MTELICKNCGDKLYPENSYLGESHRAYARCKCKNCGQEFEAVYELVDFLKK